MKRLIIFTFLILIISCGSENPPDMARHTLSKDAFTLAQGTSAPADSQGRYRQGEILVRFRPGLQTASSLRISRSTGSSLIRRYALVPALEHIKLPPGMDVEDAIKIYLSDPDVQYAEPNYIRRISSTTPDDPFFSLQWPLNNTIFPGADIDAVDAWDITRGSNSIVIAFIDTGIDYNHPDIADNIWINNSEIPGNGIDDDGNGKIDDIRGWDFVNSDNSPMDDNGHGTNVAGIAGAVGDNGTGVAGLMWHVRLMPLKILDSDGFGTVAEEIEAIQYAIDNNVLIINESLTGSEFSNAERDALISAGNAGILVVAAAGNGGLDNIGDNNDQFHQYPAGYLLPNIISVAATDIDDSRALFSNYGPNSVHVAAPGVDVLSAFPSGIISSGYAYLSGTSQSAPHVSGLAGLLYSSYPDYNYSRIRGTILRYVDKLPSLQGVIMTGGRINARKALSSLLAPSGFVLDVQSDRVILSWKDNATGEDGYAIERRTGSGSYIMLATLNAGAQSYTDSTVLDGTFYSYRITAYNYLPNPPDTTDIRAESDAVEGAGTTPLSPPTGLEAVPGSSSMITISWIDNSVAEDGYKIERRLADSGFVEIAVTAPDVTAFSDTGLAPSTQYTYRVRAFNSAAGDSLYSAEISAVTFQETGGTGGGGGGGGCSLLGEKSDYNNGIDATLLLTLCAAFLIIRLRRRLMTSKGL